MNIEEIRTFALSLHPEVTEDLFTETALSIRIHGKWFVLIRLETGGKLGLETGDIVEVINLKCDTDLSANIRMSKGILPAYHMNKEHWSDLFVERLDDGLIKQLITQSYENIIAKLPKKYRTSLALTR